MSPIAHLTPGSFCWFELATTDQAAAKRFYQSIFGWSAEDQPIGPSEMYTMFRIDGKDVAAGYTMRDEQKAQGMPPNWMIYILVSNADASTAKAEKLGATVHVKPFDVMDHGRMAVIQDPAGATFCLWQPIKNSGVGLANENGTMVWADLSTPDQTGSAAFYSNLFGWKMVGGKSMNPAKPGDYYHIVNGQDFIGGVPPSAHRDAHTPPHWLMYFAVADCDQTISKVKSLGGRVYMEPMTMEGIRRFAVLADAQGATFAIVQTLGAAAQTAAPRTPAKKASRAKTVAKPAKKQKNAARKATKKTTRKAVAKKASKPVKKAPKAARSSKASKAMKGAMARRGKASPKAKAQARPKGKAQVKAKTAKTKAKAKAGKRTARKTGGRRR